MKNKTNISTQPNANMMEIVEVVSEKAKDSRLEAHRLRELTRDLEMLAEFLGTTEKQALLFAAILTLNFRKKRVSVDMLAGYLGMTGIKMLKYLPDFRVLQDKRWIKADRDGSHKNALVSEISYFVTRSVTDRLVQNQADQKPEQFENIYQLLSALMQLSIDFDRGRISYFEMSDDAMEMMDSNEKLPYIKTLRRSGLSWQEELLFALACQRTLSGDAETDLDKITGIACGTSYEAINMKRSLVNGTSKLITSGLMKVQDGMFMNDKQVMVTNHALKIFFEEDAGLLVKTDINQAYLTRYDQIRNMPLFFDRSENEQLQRLGRLLTKKGYREVSDRLKNRNMRGGFTMLFHGAPGTGKTEAVLQLARKSRRDIMKVDPTQSKSMWFGESEKKIREIFTRYAQVCRNASHLPILFFNEADAIFGMRKDMTESTSVQTFNAMQNILLEEMERFEGILLATTNMTSNFDPAFDRRFLYKIEFHPPSRELRKKIWRAKLPEVPPRVINTLSGSYSFSGGQIENIARKFEIDSLLNGRQPNLDELIRYCEEETLNVRKQVRIGYKK